MYWLRFLYGGSLVNVAYYVFLITLQLQQLRIITTQSRSDVSNPGVIPISPESESPPSSKLPRSDCNRLPGNSIQAYQAILR